MSGEKRPAQEAFGSSSQLVVKRKKSDADLNPGTAVVKGSSQAGALIQSVRLSAITTLAVESIRGYLAYLIFRSLVPVALMRLLWSSQVR